MVFRVIIAGGRKFNDYQLLKAKLDYYLQHKVKDGYKIIIVSGGATGADSLGERYAIENGYPIERYIAEWNKYGLSAGPRRNKQMADIANACVIFWNGTSKGTKNMRDLAITKGLPLKTVYY